MEAAADTAAVLMEEDSREEVPMEVVAINPSNSYHSKTYPLTSQKAEG